MTQLERIIYHLDWMIKSLEFQNEQTGLDQQDSPEMADAKLLMEELQQGGPIYRRTDADEKQEKLHEENQQLKRIIKELKVDGHVYGSRPCPTCGLITQLIGELFGCDYYRERLRGKS